MISLMISSPLLLVIIFIFTTNLLLYINNTVIYNIVIYKHKIKKVDQFPNVLLLTYTFFSLNFEVTTLPAF